MKAKILKVILTLGVGVLAGSYLASSGCRKSGRDKFSKPPKFDPKAYRPQVRHITSDSNYVRIDSKLCQKLSLAFRVSDSHGYPTPNNREFLFNEVLLPHPVAQSLVTGDALKELYNASDKAIKFFDEDNFRSTRSYRAILKKSRGLFREALKKKRPVFFNCRPGLPSPNTTVTISDGWKGVGYKDLRKGLYLLNLNDRRYAYDYYFRSKVLTARFPADAKNIVIVLLDVHKSAETQASAVKLLQNLSRDRKVVLYGREGSQGEMTSRLSSFDRSKFARPVDRLIRKHLKGDSPSFRSISNLFEGIRSLDPRLQVSSFTPIIAQKLLKDRLRILGLSNPGLLATSRTLVHALGINDSPQLRISAFRTDAMRGIHMTRSFIDILNMRMMKTFFKSKKGQVGVMQIGVVHAREVRWVLENYGPARNLAYLFLYTEDYPHWIYQLLFGKF